MKKGSKRITLSTEAKNTKGFHVRTSGISLDQYHNNPIMLFMHRRPTGESMDEPLPPGQFVDLAVDNAVLSGVPSFDENDQYAMRLHGKYEMGIIKMASIGIRGPLELSKDENGEIWVEKCTLYEVSLCDIGSNHEALQQPEVVLYDDSETPVSLTSDYLKLQMDNKSKKTDMKLIQLKADDAVLKILGLSADASDDALMNAVTQKLNEVGTLNAQVLTLTQERDTARTSLATAQNEIKTLKAGSLDSEIKLYLEGAEKVGKITKDEISKYTKLSAGSEDGFNTVKELIDAKPENPSLRKLSEGAKPGEVDAKILELSFDEMDKKGCLAMVKEKRPDVYELKFEERYGHKPGESKE